MKKYLLIPLFVLIVVIGMFFIYSNISSPERIEYYEKEPGWLLKMECIVRGGQVKEYVEENNSVNKGKSKTLFVCHLH